MKKYNKTISFVIPCYYSEKTIEDVVDEIVLEFPNEEYDREIVLVNDGSKDRTYDVLGQLAKKYSGIKAVNLAKNFGQDAATLCGLSECTGDYIVVLDDDGQNPPSEAHKLLDEIDKGYDAVFAKYHKKKDTLFKSFGHLVNDRMVTAMIHKPKDLELNSYFVINRFVRDEMLKYKGAYPYIWGLIIRCTDSMTNVYVEHKSREVGESTYSFSKLLGLWVNGLLSFSVKPLRLTSIIGAIFCLIGFIITLVVVINTFLHGDVPGWTTLIMAILIMGGIQLLMLGMLGEYLGRVFINQNNAPQFVIRDKQGDGYDEV